MGVVVAFKKKKVRKTTIRGEARKLLTSTLTAVKNPIGIYVLAVGVEGEIIADWHVDGMQAFDLFSRVEAHAHNDKLNELAPVDAE